MCIKKTEENSSLWGICPLSFSVDWNHNFRIANTAFSFLVMHCGIKFIVVLNFGSLNRNRIYSSAMLIINLHRSYFFMFQEYRLRKHVFLALMTRSALIVSLCFYWLKTFNFSSIRMHLKNISYSLCSKTWDTFWKE